MEINSVNNHFFESLNTRFNLIDIPGQGFYKSKIIDMLQRSRAILIFIDSSDKYNIILPDKT